MSSTARGGGGPLGRPSSGEPARPAVAPYPWRSISSITAVALVLYVIVRLLPTGTNLNHMDFRVEGKGAIEFCDPANPQFIPVVAARSPVTLELRSDSAPVLGKPATFTLALRTASGKPIAPEDLLIAHTRKLHLLVVDPTLDDYQHLHPEPGRRAGDWVFKFTPQRAGTYRVFADFTPAATARSLYASADFSVPGTVARITRGSNDTFEAGGYRFILEIVGGRLQARRPADLRFRIERRLGREPIPLQPVMGAFAHLVAFNDERSGFAHLHPQEIDLAKPPDPVKPELTFKITIPEPGRYVIWAQVNLSGEEAFIPFWTDVLP